MATVLFSSDMQLHRPRRDSGSSSKSLGCRRPRLLRAYATQPSITTENACSGLLTSPVYSTRRAAELLNRVAISSSCSISPTNASPRRRLELAPEPLPETNYDSCSCLPLLPSCTISLHGGEADLDFQDSGCYFSFPSPDTWGELSHDDKEMDASP
ncbi:hypothetical protein GGS21DRAFT_496530 [Xylaria nigripes]|nr:hypothetical protein GGS21DRAFT_496530 [Xylaria nigripes]